MAALSDIDPSFEGEGGNNHVTSEVKALEEKNWH